MHLSKRQTVAYIALLISTSVAPLLHANDRRIDPTWLYRNTSTAAVKPSDITTATCHYKPLFGQGDSDSFAVAGIARYGEATIDPHGSCTTVQYPQEDQIYVVLSGSGFAKYEDEDAPLKAEDYLYIPSKTAHSLANRSAAPLKVLIMGFHTKGFEVTDPPPHPLKGNIEEVPTTLVDGHPKSTRYRLLMTNIEGKSDPGLFGEGTIASGHVLTSLFLMEMTPGGTNFPHHHEREEEIYLVLSGHGIMVAGGGTDGIAGRHPTKAGDTYFFRLNTTVGYYSAPNVKSRILCVRSWYPGLQKK